MTDQVTWTYSVVKIIIVTQKVTKSKLLLQKIMFILSITQNIRCISKIRESFTFPLIYGRHPCSRCYLGNFSLPGGHFGVLGALLAAYANSGSVSLLQIRKVW